MRGSMTPRERTISLYSALSPAMLPRAQMAWSREGEREREREEGGGEGEKGEVDAICVGGNSDNPLPHHMLTYLLEDILLR